MFIKSLFGVTLESWWWKQFKHLNGIIYSEWFSYIFNLNPKIFWFFSKEKKKDLRLLLKWMRADTTPTVLCRKINF